MRLTSLAEKAGFNGAIVNQPASVGASLPAPVEGWDAVSPISAMSPKRAIQLDNWFPQPGWVEIRKGHVVHSDTGSGLPIETLAKYQGLSSENLFACTGTEIYDVTAATAGVLSRSGIGSPRFQHVNFATTGGNFLWMCNGSDDPIYWDGSAWSAAVITGISATDIVNVNAHKNRLWFCLNNSTEVAYLPVDSIQGAATTFELGGFMTDGGYVLAMATWSVDAGNGPQDYAVFITTRGQVIIFNGTDPSSAATWGLVGVFNIGAPIGRRCFTKTGADVAIICIDGVIPLSKVMIFERAAIPNASLTQRIQRVMNEAARNYKNNFGWELISYPRGTRVILNVPLVEGQAQHQYVMNTLSGAWCRFIGMNANCWELLSDDLYFGGNDGIVYEADRGGADPDAVLTADMRGAFNYFGQKGRTKQWTMCRPLLTTDGSVEPSLAFNVDYAEDAELNAPISVAETGALWDQSLWDVGVWGEDVRTQSIWTSVSGIGFCASVRMQAQVSPTDQSSGVTLRVNSFDVLMQPGGFI